MSKFVKSKQKLFGLDTIVDSAVFPRADRIPFVRGKYGEFHLFNKKTVIVRTWKQRKVEEVLEFSVDELAEVLNLVKPFKQGGKMATEANKEYALEVEFGRLED